jgi:hypothetical protein
VREEPGFWYNKQDKDLCRLPVHCGIWFDIIIKALPISLPDQSAGRSPALLEPCPAGESQWYEPSSDVLTREEAGKVWEAWPGSRLSVTQEDKKIKQYCLKQRSKIRGSWGKEKASKCSPFAKPGVGSCPEEGYQNTLWEPGFHVLLGGHHSVSWER